MKAYFKDSMLLLLLIFSAAGALAQETATRSFTLHEAITHAVENNVTVKNERLNEGIATAQVKETVAQGLPQINISGNLTNNIQRQISFLPGEFAGNPGGFIAVPFGTPYASNVTGSVNQMIFNGSYFVGLRAAKVFKELAEKGGEQAKIDVAEAVALAYYGVLVSRERLELLSANLQRLDTLHRETRAMYENGFAEAIDVQRVRVNLNNLRTEYDNVERSMAVNMSALKFQMGIPITQEIELQENIRDLSFANVDLDQPHEYNRRIEYQQLKINRELAELDIKNTRSGYLPSLTAFANIGYVAGRPTFTGLFESTVLEEKNESGQVIGREEVATWNRFVAIGLNLNIPVFDGFLKANTIRRKKLVAEQVDNQLRNLENAIDLELEQSRINLQNSLQSLETQQENMDLAQEVFRVSKIKYQQGVGSSLEVVEAENALKTAETNYYQSLYNALVARVAYDKASGILLQN